MATENFLISAISLYKAPHFTGFDLNNKIGISVPQVDGFSPRKAWLKRYLVPGQNQVQYLLTFNVNSVEVLDPNILEGVYVEVRGEGVLIDCLNVDDFIATANGLQPSITRRYGAGIPAFTTPTPVKYCIVRLDDATGFAHDVFVTDYVGQYIGSVSIVSHLTGSTIYTFNAYGTPVPIKGDVISTC